MKGLAKNVGKYIFPVLNKAKLQTVKDVIECLEKKYRITRYEKLEELVSDWMSLKIITLMMMMISSKPWKRFKRERKI